MIPTGAYTHLIFGFALVDPKSYQIVHWNSAETDRRMAALKQRDPKLKTIIAIGGWGMTEPNAPTRNTLSDLCASEEKQTTFFNSLKSYLATYNFDGIDLDWEYPVASHRGGRPEDYANFPKFLANLKRALAGTGRNEISVSIPAPVPYLNDWYDLKAMVSQICL